VIKVLQAQKVKASAELSTEVSLQIYFFNQEYSQCLTEEDNFFHIYKQQRSIGVDKLIKTICRSLIKLKVVFNEVIPKTMNVYITYMYISNCVLLHEVKIPSI